MCYSATKDIQCLGKNVNQLPLETLKNESFGSLYIKETNITEITDKSLGNAIWDRIIISNNENLHNITAKAFKTGPKISLQISNHIKMDYTIFQGFLKNLIDTEIIELDNNNIIALPSNALHSESKIKIFDLHNNIMRRVRHDNFVGPKELEYIRLDNKACAISRFTFLVFSIK